MAFLKRTWLARLGTGLNKFLIGDKGADGKQTLTNSPDTVVQEGDVISAENLNDLEDRIETSVNANESAIVGMKLTKIWENPNPSANSFAPQLITIQGEEKDIVIEYRLTGIYGRSEFEHIKTEFTEPSSGNFNLFSLKRIQIEFPDDESPRNRVNIWTRKIDYYTSDGTTKLDFKAGILYYHWSDGTEDFGVTNGTLVPVAIYKVGDIYNS